METFSRETLEPQWVTGFVDAAGSFTYSRSGSQLALYFAIKLTAQDHLLLESLRDFFGVGKIYSVKSGAASYYRVSHRQDLLRILEHFDQHPLQSSKSRLYETWRLMVLVKQEFRNPDRAKLEALATELSKRGRF